MLNDMMKSDIANLDKVIDSLRRTQQYICRVSYKGISRNDIVEIEIGRQQVYIKHNKMVYCTNEFIISQHFEKVDIKHD